MRGAANLFRQPSLRSRLDKLDLPRTDAEVLQRDWASAQGDYERALEQTQQIARKAER